MLLSSSSFILTMDIICGLGKTCLVDVIGSSFMENDSKHCYREATEMANDIIFES